MQSHLLKLNSPLQPLPRQCIQMIGPFLQPLPTFCFITTQIISSQPVPTKNPFHTDFLDNSTYERPAFPVPGHTIFKISSISIKIPGLLHLQTTTDTNVLIKLSERAEDSKAPCLNLIFLSKSILLGRFSIPKRLHVLQPFSRF